MCRTRFLSHRTPKIFSRIFPVSYTHLSGTLTTSFTEAVTLSSGTSHEYSTQHSVSVNLTASIGRDENLFGGEAGFQYAYTWGEVTGENFSNGTEKSNSQEISSSISMTLPAHTQAVMLQETGDATMNQTFDYPVALLYDVHIPVSYTHLDVYKRQGYTSRWVARAKVGTPGSMREMVPCFSSPAP